MIEKLDSKMECIGITILGKQEECLGFDSAKKLLNKINELVDYINHSNHEYESIDDVVEDFVNVNETAHKFRSTNEQLRNQLDRTRKALDVAVDGLEKMTWGCDSSDAEHLLKEIKATTALEQKDVK